MFRTVICAILVYSSLSLIAQPLNNSNATKRGDLRIMFYNVENFFDTFDDIQKADEEFLPESQKKWDDYKCWKKTNQIFKTIAAVGENQPPEIIGFAEVENDSVLRRLVYGTPLAKYQYGIAHYESPDRRGIDVGLIYRKDVLRLITSKKIPIKFPGNPYKMTRDILFCSFEFESRDTIHLFINHWPSRSGGQKASEVYRIHVATVLKQQVDSLLATNSSVKIIIAGDFNDEPENASVSEVLEAKKPVGTIHDAALYNLSASLEEACNCGSYRYKADWNMIDQFMVSGALLNESAKLQTCINCTHIADFQFLLIEDSKYGGYKPYRTYLGPVYKGGFSDHLPIFLDVYKNP